MRSFAFSLAVITALLMGCAQDGGSRPATLPSVGSGTSCQGGLQGARLLRIDLFFGLNRPGGTVSPEEFQRFVDAEVTPRFPEGLSVFDLRGQYRGRDGEITREASRLLTLFLPSDAPRHDAVEEIRARYKALFEQESVLRLDSSVCGSF